METYPVMAPETPLEITVSDLLALKNENSVHTLLDVRELQEIAVCRLDPCLHIPYQLPSDHPLVVFLPPWHAQCAGRRVVTPQWV